ncbi:MAG: ABC transporter ATP-binding protein [bacterium]|nr:ABC transporter ATP-binding protein [bacterium]MDW8163211.1 ABC transporter ATP-binding protein [Candidatus Omnitrophota bacterium]
MNKIKGEKLTKNYNGVCGIKEVDIEILKGEIVVIIGPSGSGKTTLLNLLGLIDKPTEGKIYLDDIDVGKLSERQLAEIRNKKFGFIFQFFHLIPELKVIENVFLPLWIKEKKFSLDFLKEAEKYLISFGIFDKKDTYPSRLSGGELQRVAICRSLICKPEIIFADEPTGSIDKNSALIFFEFMKKFNEENGTTFIIATHNENFLQFASKVVYLIEGKIKEIEKRR